MDRKIKVGIIDSGFDEKSYKTKNNIIKKYNIVRKTLEINDNIQDECGHGTGIIKIIDDICDHIEFIVFKILDKKCQADDWQLIHALKLAIKENIDILNISLGTTNKDVEFCIRNLCDIAKQKGIIIVCTCSKNEEQLCCPYNLESVIKVKANSNITDFNVYYEDNVFLGRGTYHLIPWLDRNLIYSGSNSFATPYIVAKLVNILNKNIESKNVIDELKKQSYHIQKLNQLIIKKEKCEKSKLFKDLEEIIKNVLDIDNIDTRLTLQRMNPELSVKILRKIEEKYNKYIMFSVYNYIDFEYIENIANKIKFVDQ